MVLSLSVRTKKMYDDTKYIDDSGKVLMAKFIMRSNGVAIMKNQSGIFFSVNEDRIVA